MGRSSESCKEFRMTSTRPLATALNIAARDFGSLLNASKAGQVNQFLDVPMIDNSIPMMAELYRNTGVGSLQGLETVVKANFREAQVRDAWEELLDVQRSWDDFLTKADSKGPQGLDVGTNAPLATRLVNARTGVFTHLGQVLQEATLDQENKCLHLVLLRFFG